MGAKPFGKVTVTSAGTPVIATANFTDLATKGFRLHGIMFEVWPTNTGLMYVGLQGMNKTTGVGVLAILGLPSLDSGAHPVFLPTFSMALTISPNGFGATDFYIDAEVSGNALLVTGLQA